MSAEITEPYLEATAFGDKPRTYVSASKAQRLQEELKAKLAEKAENTVDFEELAGTECDFYGVDGSRFRLDDVTYEFVERSGDYDIVKASEPINGLPIARVEVSRLAFDDDSYEIIDLHDEHEWLSFGTIVDSYGIEPYFDYTPKSIGGQCE